MNDHNVQKPSERLGNVPKGSESRINTFGKLRKDSHTLTTREVVRRFEGKGVDITERSVTNYCHPNKGDSRGVPLLDCFWENNEGRWYVTPESVDKAVDEVRARKMRLNEPSSDVPKVIPKVSEDRSEGVGNIPKGSESSNPQSRDMEIDDLRRKNRDLEVINEVKERFIETLQERESKLIIQLQDSSYRIGVLEAEKSRLLGGPVVSSHGESEAGEEFGRQRATAHKEAAGADDVSDSARSPFAVQHPEEETAGSGAGLDAEPEHPPEADSPFSPLEPQDLEAQEEAETSQEEDPEEPTRPAEELLDDLRTEDEHGGFEAAGPHEGTLTGSHNTPPSPPA